MFSVSDYEKSFNSKVDSSLRDYLTGAANDGTLYNENEAAFKRYIPIHVVGFF